MKKTHLRVDRFSVEQKVGGSSPLSHPSKRNALTQGVFLFQTVDRTHAAAQASISGKDVRLM